MRISPALLLFFGGVAHAEELVPTSDVHESAATGAFLPFMDTPSSPASVVKAIGVYNGARDASAVVFTPVAKIATRLQLQVSLSYEDEALEREAMAQVNILDEHADGLDLQLSGGYDSAGINEVRAGFAMLGIGRDVNGTYAMSTVRFDYGLDGGERGLAIGLGSARTITDNIYAGLDTKLQLDLERDDDEPMGESTWQLTSGPAVTYAASHFTITASAGVAVDKPRMAAREVGAFGAVGIGTAF